MRLNLFKYSFAFAMLAASMVLSSFVTRLQEEYGKAGYYSDALNGRKTSSGEVYDKTAFTCSHKSLPFGTKVRVTRLDNKKSVIVRVNDRGPHLAGYVVDLSRAAAEVLDLIKAGSAQVKLEVVETADAAAPAASAAAPAKAAPAKYSPPAAAAKPASATRLIKAKEGAPAPAPSKSLAAKGVDAQPVAVKPAPTKVAAPPAAVAWDVYKIGLKKSDKKGFAIQVSTLTDAENVFPMVDKLEQSWPGKSMVSIGRDDPGKMQNYKILIGPYPDRKSAEAQQKIVAKKGYPNCYILDLKSL